MGINKSRSMRFTPTGLVDAFDSTNKFPGACTAITNLIFDPGNPELVTSRPGVTLLTNLAQHGFNNPGFISIQASIGTRIYGMVASNLNPGFDQPFCYDTATSSFVPITGITSANVPASPATSGTWTPPTLANIGTMIVITHPGFTGTNGYYGIIDITNSAAPVWRSENTTTIALTGVPIAVANFNNRAYFAVGNQLQFTDILTNPLTITNANQALIIGDTGLVIALSGLPVQTTSSGVIQSLTVFKQNTQVWQVTGDPVFNNLSLNYVDLTTGTNSPRSVVQAPQGIYFSSTGGLYIVDLLGSLRQVTHSLQEADPDLRVPFQNAQVSSRWAAGYCSGVYRICGQTVVRGIGGTNDYWFDEHRRRWNGPHTFTYDCASQQAGYWVLSGAQYPGQLIRSNPWQTLDFVNTDLGGKYAINLATSTFPKTGDQAKKQVAESTIELAATGSVINYTIVAQNEIGLELGRATIGIAPNGGSVWNNFIWNEGAIWTNITSLVWDGGEVWDGGTVWDQGNIAQIPVTVPVPWSFPLVFEKMQLIITADTGNASIGTFYARYQQTGYQVLGVRTT